VIAADLIKGIIVGFLIAAPVGPIGVLCIRRTVSRGQFFGFVSGLGAATADTLFGLAAALGLGAFTTFLVVHRQGFQLAAGVILVVLGLRMLCSTPARSLRDSTVKGHGGAYFSTLGLTLANPMTILSFAGIFAGFGVVTGGSDFAAATLVLGVFIGSASWWLILSALAGWLVSRMQEGGLHRINQIGGAAIFLFGLWNLGKAAYPALR